MANWTFPSIQDTADPQNEARSKCDWVAGEGGLPCIAVKATLDNLRADVSGVCNSSELVPI